MAQPRRIRCERIGAGTCDLCGPGSSQVIRITLGLEPHHRVVQICDRCAAADKVTYTTENAALRKGRGTCVVCSESLAAIAYIAHTGGRKVIAETWSSKTPKLVQVCPPCVGDMNGRNLLRSPDLLSGSITLIEWQKGREGALVIVYAQSDGNGAELGGAAGEFRYSLWRRWWSTPPMVFVMINPSTADATQDDPTIRRCCAFAHREARGGVVVVNLFAWRSSSPRILGGGCRAGTDIVGPSNDVAIALALEIPGALVVAAWGQPTRVVLREAAGLRAEKVAAAARARGVQLHSLALTKDGWPKHPLYLRADSPLTPWP